MILAGIEIIESPFVPSSRFIPEPPRNRREARKRQVINRRRRRAGLPVPRYGRIESGYAYIVADGKIICAPGMTAKIKALLEAT